MLLNAPRMIAPAGRNRNATVYAKKGSVGSHASESRFRPDLTSGRSASDATFVAIGLGTDPAGPPGRDERLGLRLLAGARELDLRIERPGRKRREQPLRDHFAGGQVGEPGRV